MQALAWPIVDHSAKHPAVRALINQIEDNIRRRHLIADGAGVVGGVSGGVDSMVLLQVLAALAPKHGWKLTVAHLNHQLRGPAAAADARMVQRAARSLGLECVLGQAKVRELAKRSGQSVEMAARQARHEFLARTARRCGARVIVLAHHADDQVELFFLRLLRGAGGEGLGGMKWIGSSPVDASLRLVRPLLDVAKADLRRVARQEQIQFAEDATNASVDILRNRIRRELLPLLARRYQPGIAQTVARSMEVIGAEAELAGMMGRLWLKTNLPEFNSLPVALQRQALLEQLLRLKLPPDFQWIEKLRESPGQAVSVGAGKWVCRDVQGRLHWTKPDWPQPSVLTEQTLALTQRSGRAAFGGLEIRWTRLSRAGQKAAAQPGREHFDAVKVGRRIRLRHWRPGDRFHLIGAPGPKKLQDIFTDLKVPRAERTQRVVALAENGEIFWVEGLRIGEWCKLDAQTEARLRWEWRRSVSLGRRS